MKLGDPAGAPFGIRPFLNTHYDKPLTMRLAYSTGTAFIPVSDMLPLKKK